MTTKDPDAVDDAKRSQASARAHEMACRAMREHPTPEGRDAARLEALRLEKKMTEDRP